MGPLSYIIPAYNCCGTISETVASIYTGNIADDDEIVIVDDGSTDGTAHTLKELAAHYEAIRVVTQPCNRGGAVARNTAVENARHDLMFCLDSDNVLISNSVGDLRTFQERENADGAAFREVRYFRDQCQDTTHIWRYRDGVVTLADYLAGSVVPGASGNYLFTRASWKRAGGYPEFAGALDTWGFGLRQVATGQKMMVMPTGAYQHRYGHDSYWVREARKGRISLTALRILVPFIDQISDSDIKYILRSSGRTDQLTWYWNLDRRPIRMINGRKGHAGIALDLNGKMMPVGNGGVRALLLAPLRRLVRRLGGRAVYNRLLGGWKWIRLKRAR